MFLFYKRILLILFLLISFEGGAQTLENEDFDSVLNSELSFSKKEHFIDSITKLNNYSEEKLSYLYHIYARYLSKSKKSDLSIVYIKKAIKIRKKNQNKDVVSLKKSLFNLGLYMYRERDYIETIEVFKELTELPKEDRLRMKAFSELITLYYRIGDYEKSISYFNKTEDYYIYKNDYRNLYKNYMRIASVYSAMEPKNNDVIINYLFKIDSLKSFTSIDKSDNAIINMQLGIAYREKEEKEKALLYYKKALGFNRELQDSAEIARIYNSIGILYLKDSSLNMANDAFQLSSDYIKEDRILQAGLFNNYGKYHQQLKEFDKAELCYQKAIQLWVYGLEKKHYNNPTIKEISTVPYKLSLFESVLDKAKFWYERYDLEKKNDHLQKALVDLELADKLIDIIRFDTSEKVSKMYWRQKGAALYAQAVEVCYLLDDTDKAYFFMEKNKALLLLEELSDQQAKVVSNLPKQLIERDFLFKQQVIEIEEKGTKNNDELFEIKRKYEQFKDSLSTNYPAYSKLRKTLPVLKKQEHSNQFIDETTASMQFIIHENKGYGLVVTKDKSYIYPILDVTSLEKEVDSLIYQLQQPFNTNKNIEVFVKNASTIFKRLVPDDVYAKIKGKKLIISADGNLQNIPFEALLSNAKDSSSYFIKTNEISYVYSFSYLLSNAKKKRNPEHTFLGFAPQTFKDKSLAVLSNSINEVSSINSIFSDTVFTGENATKENFKSNFENFKIVHLATHSGSSNTEKPWLAFNDEKVNLNEIYGTHNQADLVVLSACKTSQGELKTGEGVMSLARGFFFSGTNSVISTLWNINDKTTQELMHSFYTNIKKGQTKSNALHQSKLAYLSTHEGSMASPFYWSSFVLIGDATVIAIESDFNWTLPIVLLVVLSSIIILVSFRKRRRKYFF